MEFLSRYSSQILGITRIVSGLIFLEHGTMKILGFPAGMHPPLMSMGGAAGIIELIAGALIVLGLFSRPAAFIASGEMAFAYFIGHAPRAMFPAEWRRCGDLILLPVFVFGCRRSGRLCGQ